MTVTWAHGERVQRWSTKDKYVRHAFKNQIAGMPSICGRGRFPQDATPPATLPPVCKVCVTKSRPPDGPMKGGPYERGQLWAQERRSVPMKRHPRGYYQ